MRRIFCAALVAFALTAGCHNFGANKTGSQTMSYDRDEAKFVPANDGLSKNGETMGMQKP